MRVLLLGAVILLIAGKPHDVLKSIQSLNNSIARVDFELLAKVVAGINFTDDSKMTALHLATQAGNLPAVKSLLLLGADPHLPDALHRTPFDYLEQQAITYQLSTDQMRIASLLLEKMNGLNGVDQGGWSPLMWAIVAGDLQRVEELLDAGANFTLWGDNGIASLARQLKDKEILKIIEAHLDANTTIPSARLLLAVETDNRAQIEQSIAELTEDDSLDETFLYSLLHGHQEATWILLEHLSHVNVKLDFYGTPLQQAINAGQLELAHTLLVQYGANPNLIAGNGHSPLMDAINMGYLNLAHTLLDYGANASYINQGYSNSTSALNEAIISGDLELTRRIIELVGDVNRQQTRGRIAMLIATSRGDIDMLQLLISYGGNVNIIDNQSNLPTCLHVTSCQGDTNMAQLLLNYGAELNATNMHGDTPLIIAVRIILPSMVQFLLKHGSDHRLVNKQGKTALDIAKSATDWVVGDREKLLKIINLLEEAETNTL